MARQGRAAAAAVAAAAAAAVAAVLVGVGLYTAPATPQGFQGGGVGGSAPQAMAPLVTYPCAGAGAVAAAEDLSRPFLLKGCVPAAAMVSLDTLATLEEVPVPAGLLPSLS